jgi:hypothetical protein
MNTKLVMTSSAILMGLVGILFTFLPEIVQPQWGNAIVVQILGALYFGFAMVNWMSKANLIGGIYNRPLAVGNLSHFLIAALALIKISMRGTTTIIVTAALIYSLFAIAFGYILFTHPVKESRTE